MWRQLKVHFSHFAVPRWGLEKGAHDVWLSAALSDLGQQRRPPSPAPFTGAARRLLIGQHVRKPKACWGAELQLLPSRSHKSSSKVPPLLCLRPVMSAHVDPSRYSSSSRCLPASSIFLFLVFADLNFGLMGLTEQMSGRAWPGRARTLFKVITDVFCLLWPASRHFKQC